MTTSFPTTPSTSGSSTSTAGGNSARGRVIFVGTGPGDPELLTLAAVRTIAEADVVLLDHVDLRRILTHPSVQLTERVEVLVVGTRDNGKILPPAARARQAVKLAASGGRVVRLVFGDPFLEGNVAEEAAACLKHGIEFEVIPGVSSLTAVAEYAGVPLSRGAHFVTADGRVTKASAAAWAQEGTLVVSTRAEFVADVASAAIAVGRGGDDHAVLTLDGGSAEQSTVVTTLHRLAAAIAQTADLDPETRVHLMIGPAAEPTLSWYQTKPLFGWRVLVPRTKDQAGEMVHRLRSHGAMSDVVPTISVEPPRNPQQLDRAVRGLVEGAFEWVVFTSANAVRAIRDKFEEYGLDARALSGLKVAAVGQTTAGALQAWGIEPDLVPAEEQSSQGLVAEFPPYEQGLDPINRVFLPRADIATETLSSGLVDLGWEVEDVTAYRTVRAAPPAPQTRESIKAGDYDAVVFTSSSTVRNLVGIAGKPHPNTIIAAIGPATAKTCEEHGLRVDVISPEPAALILADALADFAAERRDALVAAEETVRKPSELPRGRRR